MKDFLAKLNEDKAFADEIAAAKSEEELIAKIKAAGFDVTEADLAGTGELTDDELNAVAGGSVMDRLFQTCERCGHRYMSIVGCSNCGKGTLSEIVGMLL